MKQVAVQCDSANLRSRTDYTKKEKTFEQQFVESEQEIDLIKQFDAPECAEQLDYAQILTHRNEKLASTQPIEISIDTSPTDVNVAAIKHHSFKAAYEN